MSHSSAKNAGDDLRDSAEAVKDAVVDLAVEAKDYASDRIGEARESAAVMIDTVKTTAQDYNKTIVGFIRKNPYKSLAIAAGAGLLAGFLLRRR